MLTYTCRCAAAAVVISASCQWTAVGEAPRRVLMVNCREWRQTEILMRCRPMSMQTAVSASTKHVAS